MPHRATRDADLLGFGASDLESVAQDFRDIAGIAVNDGIVFDPTSVVAEGIRKEAGYAGARILISGELARARCKTQIDIGFGDAVTPGPIDATYPVLLDDLPAPRLRTYPVYTVVAEKLHAIALLGMTNSRVKDYLDLSVLLERETLDTDLLAQAIKATFERRGMAVPANLPVGLTDEYAHDHSRQALWQAFIKNAQRNNNRTTEGVMEKRYVATLSRSQGRSAWAVIFRHPVRVDPNTGKNGLRVRQGLGTSDDAEANDLKEQLNQLLSDESYWSLPAKAEAEKRFHRRVVEIFYHGMKPEESDFGAIRESIIPLPILKDSDYRRALLLGTTGTGKTTLLRQLIGTDPETERFPSTSTAKTTVHETEVVLAPGPYKAVVTFFPIDEVREHLNECVSEAVLSAYRGDGDSEVLRKLLMHVNQRFRFNYVLGNGPLAAHTDDEDDDEDDTAEPTEEAAADDAIDLEATNALLTKTLSALRAIAARHGDKLKTELGAIDEKDQRVVDELFEEELDRRLREDDEFHRVSDELMDEIELRFSLLADGTVRRNKQGWPQSWSWETDDRATFVKTVMRFSSNHSPSLRASADAAGEWRPRVRRVPARMERRAAAQTRASRW